MPSVTELYYSVGGHKADKYLKPEELSALEGGLKYRSDGVSGTASVYYNHCKNLIDWIRYTAEGPNGEWHSVNFGTINSTGIEAALRFDFDRLWPSQHFLRSVDVAYHYIDQNKQEHDGLQSRYVLEFLRHKIVAGMQLHVWNKLNMTLAYRFADRTGSYTDVQGQVQTYRPYSIVDARMSWNDAGYKLYVEANNLSGKKYVDVGNVPQPGAWVTAGCSIDIDL